MALKTAPLQQNYFWIAEPISLLVLTGLGFSLLGSALERVMDPSAVHQQGQKKTEENNNRRPS